MACGCVQDEAMVQLKLHARRERKAKYFAAKIEENLQNMQSEASKIIEVAWEDRTLGPSNHVNPYYKPPQK